MAQASGPRRRPGNAPRRAGQRTTPRRTRRPANTKSKPGVSSGKSNGSSSNNKNSLAKLLSPENIQDTVKSVGNLRTQVKRWMGYLQQADQMLDTVFFTTNSLRETGVLDKIVKQKGKNLSTEDFTNILVALMNSPAGSQLFKSFGGSDSASETEAVESAPENQQLIQGQTASARRQPGNGRKRPARRQG